METTFSSAALLGRAMRSSLSKRSAPRWRCHIQQPRPNWIIFGLIGSNEMIVQRMAFIDLCKYDTIMLDRLRRVLRPELKPSQAHSKVTWPFACQAGSRRRNSDEL